MQEHSFHALAPGGVLVSAVSEPDPERAAHFGVRATFILVEVNRAALEEIAKLLEAGRVSARVGAVLPLRDARRAHEMLEGLAPGARLRIVLRADSDSNDGKESMP